MRCFIAIEVPEEVRKELTKMQELLKSGNIRAKFVEPENLHITLKFLGEITGAKAEKIKDLLRQIKMQPFKAKLDSLGVFTMKNPRVIWADMLPIEQITGLQWHIDHILEKLGFDKEKRFEAHIALARVKEIKDMRSFLENMKKIKIKPVEFEIKGFVLKKSTLTQERPIYEDIERF